MRAVKPWQIPTEKPSLCAINEPYEEDVGDELSNEIVFQQPAKADLKFQYCFNIGRGHMDS